MKGERGCFPCSPSGGAALQTRRPSDLSPDEAKLSLAQLLWTPGTPASPQSPVHPDPHSRLFILSWPGVSWGYRTPVLWVKIFFSKFLRRNKSISDPKLYFNIEMFPRSSSSLYASMQAEQSTLGPLLGKQCEILRIQCQEYCCCKKHVSPKCQLFMSEEKHPSIFFSQRVFEQESRRIFSACKQSVFQSSKSNIDKSWLVYRNMWHQLFPFESHPLQTRELSSDKIKILKSQLWHRQNGSNFGRKLKNSCRTSLLIMRSWWNK